MRFSQPQTGQELGAAAGGRNARATVDSSYLAQWEILYVQGCKSYL
jgi:hypothetical protein